MARERAFWFELIVMTHPDGLNHGRAQARNLALPQLRNDWVLLLDSDMRLEPDAASRHCELLPSGECVSVGSGPIPRDAKGHIWARYQYPRP